MPKTQNKHSSHRSNQFQPRERIVHHEPNNPPQNVSSGYGSINDTAQNTAEEKDSVDLIWQIRHRKPRLKKRGRRRAKPSQNGGGSEVVPLLGERIQAQSGQQQNAPLPAAQEQHHQKLCHRPPPVLIHNSIELYNYTHGKLPTSPQQSFLRDTLLRRAQSSPLLQETDSRGTLTSSPQQVVSSHQDQFERHIQSATDRLDECPDCVFDLTSDAATMSQCHHDSTPASAAVPPQSHTDIPLKTISSLGVHTDVSSTNSSQVPQITASSISIDDVRPFLEHTATTTTQTLEAPPQNFSPSPSQQQAASSTVSIRKEASPHVTPLPLSSSDPQTKVITSVPAFLTSIFFPPIVNVLHHESLLSLIIHAFHYSGLIFFFFCASLFFLAVLLYDIFWLKHGGGWNDERYHDDSFSGSMTRFFHIIVYSRDGQVQYWHMLLFVSFFVLLGIALFLVLFSVASLLFEVFTTIVQYIYKEKEEAHRMNGQQSAQTIQQVIEEILQEEDVKV
uniref:Uncharacterized protein n=1 Tax=Percolomonas cosmopolitus TaxID=63605 RepID=A0A7S1PH20_9EUKA|mmetsp:Transcript_11214/g.41983  ORF Transcript_11214/g.41983 Transcript_11214/m.41983 type:complete len:504 (+) Transcript_11214:241-1752(+)